MATNSIANATANAISEAPLTSLAPELHPDVEHLATEDETPVDNLFSEKQQRLLTEPLYSSWPGAGHQQSFLAMANVAMYYGLKQPAIVPDVLLSLDVQCPANLWSKPNRSYFIWEYGKPPDAVVEIVSNREGGEDTEKLAAYARIHIPYYAMYDPEKAISDQPLRVFRLEGMQYREMEQPVWLPEVGLGLRIWQGTFEGHENSWLRWVDELGHPIATGAERAGKERDRADKEHERAEKLAEQLRQLGVDPEV